MTQKETELKKEVIEILKSYVVDDAQEIIKRIEEMKKTGEVDSVLSEELDVYIVLLKFISFATLPENEQLSLFEKHIVKAIRVGIDLKNRFTIKLHLIPAASWPETAQLFVEAIIRNNEKIGRNPITVNGENQSSPQTVSNWLRDYNRIHGMDRHEKIITHRHLSENPNAQRLKSDEKAILLKLLEFYEGIKFPSHRQIQEAVEKAYRRQAAKGEIDLEPEDTGNEILTGVKNEMADYKEEAVSEDINLILSKFPKAGDQLIGEKPIQMLQNGEWVQPTVNNWLADYRTYAGAGPHETKERSDYLLRSPNTQNLNTKDREKLGLLLRSYDENYILKFSKDRQEILF